MGYAKSDFWTQKARKEGYPARSVYKLQEMDAKFGLFPSFESLRDRGRVFSVFDAGASPGSWSLYALRKLKTCVKLVSCDLLPLSRSYDGGLFDGNNFTFLQQDLFAEETREALRAFAPFDLVMSDAAPATTGSRAVDSERSLQLSLAVLSLAERFLASSGTLVIKVFQGADTSSLAEAAKKVFVKTRFFKPQTCRSNSFEVYFTAQTRK